MWGLDWGIEGVPILSPRDQNNPRLRDIPAEDLPKLELILKLNHAMTRLELAHRIYQTAHLPRTIYFALRRDSHRVFRQISV